MQDPCPTPKPPESESQSDETDCLPRLLLEPTMSRTGLFDGAWWPRSRDVMAELPDLITALSAYLGHIPRVALDTSAWDDVPRSVTVNGCTVKIGRFTTTTGTITISRSMQDHFLLLVVPPDASPQSALSAMTGATETGNHTPADELLLSAADAPTPPPDSKRRLTSRRGPRRRRRSSPGSPAPE